MTIIGDIMTKTLSLFLLLSCILFSQETPQSNRVDVILDPSRQTPTENLSTDSSIFPSTVREEVRVKDKPLNDLFRVLAQRCNLNYSSNDSFDTKTYTGRFDMSNPRDAIKEICESRGLISWDNEKSLFVRNIGDVASMPQKSLTYKFKNLKMELNNTVFTPDIKKVAASANATYRIEQMIKPLLTQAGQGERGPTAGGEVKFDPTFNTVLVVDNEYALKQVKEFLDQIDVPKRSISFNLQIITYTDNEGKLAGVDWSKTLGADGYSISLGTGNSLQSLFNLNGTGYRPSGATGDVGDAATGARIGNIVAGSTTAAAKGFFAGPTAAILQPGAITSIIRLLTTITKSKQATSQNLLLRDGVPGQIKNINRVPIIEYQPTTSGSTTSSFVSTSSTVRYTLNKDNPEEELGVSVRLLGTILENGSIEVSLDTVSGTQTGTNEVATGTSVNSTVPTYAISNLNNVFSVPNGYSAVLGGQVTQVTSLVETKIPLLGDIPYLGNLFKNKNTTSDVQRIVLFITPYHYNPLDLDEADKAGNRMKVVVPQNLPTQEKLELDRPIKK